MKADEIHRQQVIRLNEGQKEMVRAKENEIKKVNQLFNEKIKEAKTEGDERLANQIEKNRIDIVESIQNKEETLGKVKDSLANEQNVLKKEHQSLLDRQEDQINDLNQTYDEKYSSLYDNARQKARDIHENTTEIIKDIERDTDQKVKEKEFHSRLRLNSATKEQESEFLRKENDLDRVTRENEKRHLDILDHQKSGHQQKIKDQNLKNIVEYKQREIANQAKLSYLENQQNELLKQKEASFQQKFKSMEETHKSILDRLKAKYDGEINKLSGRFAENKEVFDRKSSDPFYQISKLDPQVSSDEKAYFVTLEIPPHEAETVNLTAQDREVAVTLTRQFSGNATDESGATHQSKRSEVFTKRLQVPEILNGRQIERTYQDGILTYRIAKR